MKCIYCQEASLATRQAHVAPQALLPNDLLLPMGAECDSCNEYAGQLETAFIHHNRIWTILMVAGIPGKKGKPRKRLGNLTRDGDKLTFDRRAVVKVTSTPTSVDVEFRDPPEFDDLKFRRGLHHLAFNYLARKKGVDFAHQARFDAVRRYVRRAKPREAWPYAQVMYPDWPPNKNLRLTLMEEAPGYTVRFISFLDEFYVDLLNTGELHTWAERTLPGGVGLL
jgi:hypothetical protein